MSRLVGFPRLGPSMQAPDVSVMLHFYASISAINAMMLAAPMPFVRQSFCAACACASRVTIGGASLPVAMHKHAVVCQQLLQPSSACTVQAGNCCSSCQPLSACPGKSWSLHIMLCCCYHTLCFARVKGLCSANGERSPAPSTAPALQVADADCVGSASSYAPHPGLEYMTWRGSQATAFLQIIPLMIITSRMTMYAMVTEEARAS